MTNWFKRAWAKIRRRKDARRGEADLSPLREFIYLDEVSVYSLRASRQGAIKSEQTDSETKEWRQRIDSELAASAPVAKAGVKSQFETSSSQETQVARKWLIQSTFKELVEHERDAMRIRSSDQPGTAPSDLKVGDLVKMSEEEGVLRCSTLKRGDLLELEIELAPEDVFTASQLVKAMFMFFEEMPDQFRLDRGTFELGKRLDSMFERLLVGLVPIRARIAGRQVLKVDGEQLLVSDHLFQAHPHLSELDPEPVYLVGVAERDLFWRDLRRVLFSKSRFQVMCRASGDGLTENWNPIKMANVISEVAPTIGNEIQELPKSFVDAFRHEIETADSPTDTTQDLALAFAKELAKKAETQWVESDSLSVDLTLKDPNDVEERRALSGRVVSRLEGRLDTTLEPQMVAEVRSEVFEDDDPVDDDLAPASNVSSSHAEANLLETEIVAIYW